MAAVWRGVIVLSHWCENTITPLSDGNEAAIQLFTTLIAAADVMVVLKA